MECRDFKVEIQVTVDRVRFKGISHESIEHQHFSSIIYFFIIPAFVRRRAR